MPMPSCRTIALCGIVASFVGWLAGTGLAAMYPGDPSHNAWVYQQLDGVDPDAGGNSLEHGYPFTWTEILSSRGFQKELNVETNGSDSRFAGTWPFAADSSFGYRLNPSFDHTIIPNKLILVMFTELDQTDGRGSVKQFVIGRNLFLKKLETYNLHGSPIGEPRILRLWPVTFTGFAYFSWHWSVLPALLAGLTAYFCGRWVDKGKLLIADARTTPSA